MPMKCSPSAPIFLALGTLFFASTASAAPTETDTLSIPLSFHGDIRTTFMTFTCKPDKANAASAQLLAAIAPHDVRVAYINAGEIRLAVLPVAQRTQVFTNVLSGSGAKYVAAQYSWWTKGDVAYVANEMEGDARLTCTRIAHH